jgi:flagellar hook-associated protein 2
MGAVEQEGRDLIPPFCFWPGICCDLDQEKIMVSSVNNSTGTSIVNSLTNSMVDIGTLAKNLVEASRAPLQARIDESKLLADNKISSIARIYSAADQMKQALAVFGDPKSIAMQPRSSDATKASFSFRAYQTPQALDMSVKVTQLASVNSVTLNGLNDSAGFPTTGKLEIYSGQRATGTGSPAASFDYDDYTSLEGLRDAINTDGNFSATIMTSVSDSGPVRYLTISRGSGSAKNFYLNEVDSTSGLSLSPRVFVNAPTIDANTQEITEDRGQASGKDARVEVGGVIYNSPTNRFSSLVPGTNIDINETASVGDTVRLYTTRDTAKYKELVNAVVSSYNTLLATITNEIRYDKDVQSRGGLSNDSVARNFLAQMRRMTTDTIGTVNGKDVTFAQIGVKTSREGPLEIDMARFNQVAEERPEIMDAVISSSGTRKGILERMNGLTDVVLGRNSDFVRLFNRTNNVELPKIADKKEKLNTEMDALYARYISQFTAMQNVLKSTATAKDSLTTNMEAWTAGLKS